jgi:3-oxoadipate enol-lactonase
MSGGGSVPYAINPRAQRIYYETFGESGPVVVMIMGIGVSGRFWLNIPREVASHPEHPYRVIVIDNRGTGFSDRPFTPWTMAHMADDVATVLDAVKVERADVVGISMGGMIAQHVALRHPDRVGGLVLMCTMPGLPFGALPRPWAIQTLVKGFANGLRGEEFMKLVYPAAALEKARANIKKGIWREAVRAEIVDMRTVLYQMLAIASHSTGHRLKNIRCPTVVVTGCDDALIPTINSHRMDKRIPGAVLNEIRDCGHDMITIAPEAVYDSLRRLRTMRGTSSAA